MPSNIFQRIFRFNFHYKNNDGKKYLFIGGCARSGTSALTKIIGSHKNIVLGMERFNNLLDKENYSLSKNHFIKERFFDIQFGDTFYNDFNQFHSWEPNIYKKFDLSVYIGVKYTDIHKIIDELNSTFGEVNIFYIYRNIFDVAESWNKRAEKGNNWPSTKNYKEAVETWNQSLETIKRGIETGHKIHCIHFEDLLFSKKSIDELFKKINLNIDKNVLKTLKKLRNNAPGKRMIKGVLTDEEKIYIEENANFELYDYFNENLNLLM